MVHKEDILALVSQYMANQENAKTWEPGKDWVEYSGPTFSSKEYVNAIDTLLGGWLIFGEKCREFEDKFAPFMGTKFGCLTNSGSSANLLMTSTAMSKKFRNRLKKGDKVITPVVCFPTTVNPAIQLGLELVFVDVTLPSLNLDLDKVEEALEADSDIRGILFAHVLGNPPDMDRLMGMVEKYGLVLLEDACDALGSTYKGRKLGSYGDISTCSFFPAHHMTMGEGGFVATNNGSLRAVISSIRDWGRACYCNYKKPGCVTSGTACGDRFKNWLPGMPEAVYDHRYVFDEIGYNLKPLDLQAAMGLAQLDKLEYMDSRRRANFSRLESIFTKYTKYFHLPKAQDNSDPCWFAFLLTIREGSPFSKEEFVRHLEDAKIQTRSYFGGNILAHPGYSELAEKSDKKFPIADFATLHSFFLGTFAGLTGEKLNYIEKTVDLFFEGKEW